MTYDQFLDMPTSFVDDMARIISLKNKYRLDFTQEEREINQHILTFMEEMKINELRYKFEKCWEIEE
jgi:hypothetical protein